MLTLFEIFGAVFLFILMWERRIVIKSSLVNVSYKVCKMFSKKSC